LGMHTAKKKPLTKKERERREEKRERIGEVNYQL
jgi:hypothetical protein